MVTKNFMEKWTYNPIEFPEFCPWAWFEERTIGEATACDLGADILATAAAPLGIWKPNEAPPLELDEWDTALNVPLEDPWPELTKFKAVAELAPGDDDGALETKATPEN